MIEFKKAGPSDAEAIVRLVNSAYRGDSARVGWTHEADLLGGQRVDFNMIIEMMTEKNSSIELALEDHRIVGCMNLKFKNDYLYFGMLTVNPEIQNRGIGKKLLEEVERHARDLKIPEIRMTALRGRTELIEYYKRRGYDFTGNSEVFPDDPRNGIPNRTDLLLLELSKKLK
jgi:ribosomal protein S18 acetylase RimI-like enzyme